MLHRHHAVRDTARPVSPLVESDATVTLISRTGSWAFESKEELANMSVKATAFQLLIFVLPSPASFLCPNPSNTRLPLHKRALTCPPVQATSSATCTASVSNHTATTPRSSQSREFRTHKTSHKHQGCPPSSPAFLKEQPNPAKQQAQYASHHQHRPFYIRALNLTTTWLDLLARLFHSPSYMQRRGSDVHSHPCGNGVPEC